MQPTQESGRAFVMRRIAGEVIMLSAVDRRTRWPLRGFQAFMRARGSGRCAAFLLERSGRVS